MSTVVRSALWPVIVAVEAALTFDTYLTGRITGVFTGKVPEPTAVNYITFTVPSEGDFQGFFNRRGSEGAIQIDIWTDAFDEAAIIYEDVARILSNQNLPLGSGHVMINGSTRLITIVNDPDDDSLVHGIVRYEWVTLA